MENIPWCKKCKYYFRNEGLCIVNLVNSVRFHAMLHFTIGVVTKRFRTVQPLVQPSLTKHWKIVTFNHPRDTDSFMACIEQRCGCKPNLTNSVEILAFQTRNWNREVPCSPSLTATVTYETPRLSPQISLKVLILIKVGILIPLCDALYSANLVLSRFLKVDCGPVVLVPLWYHRVAVITYQDLWKWHW